MPRVKRLAVIVAVAVVAGLAAQAAVRRWVFAPTFPPDGRTGAEAGEGIEVVASGLDVPWDVAFLPGGDLLVTERPGYLVRLSGTGDVRWRVEVPGVRPRGEGGLLGLVLHPDFAETGWIVLYMTADAENRVERWTVTETGSLSEPEVLVEGIPVAAYHDGGRLEVGPDGALYVTTGDAGNRGAARNPASLAGKILRVDLRDADDDGAGPAPTVQTWSMGHRNPQGLAWDPQGRLWATEHGRSGLSSGLDEVNLVHEGADYGWPDFQGSTAAPGVEAPVLHSGESATWAPSGAAWWDGGLFFGGLRGEAVYEVTGLPGSPELVVHFFREYGRIRQVRVGPDGNLYILTGNRDGRGRPRSGDDHILRWRRGEDPGRP